MPRGRFVFFSFHGQELRETSDGQLYKMKLFDVVLVFASLWVCHCQAYLTYDSPTEDCSTFSTLGQGIYCYDGACYDGTDIFTKTGLCAEFDDPCSDPLLSISCEHNQVLTWAWVFAVFR
jgi:hypothetical protein